MQKNVFIWHYNCIHCTVISRAFSLHFPRHVARIVSFWGNLSVCGQTYFEYYYTAIIC